MLKTILITNDPALAADAQSAGVSRIMVDLESHGKKERQASRNTFIASHNAQDVGAIGRLLSRSELLVRINPWHAHSPAEIDSALSHGAKLIMLPMITSLLQVDACLQALAGRAALLPLIETSYSMSYAGIIASYSDIGEVYIGLNDLHLSLGMDFLFEPLGLGLIDWAAQQITAHKKPFGFGGIARMGSGMLPAEYILGEHVRLGSSCVILSSQFAKDVQLENPQGRAQRIALALEDMQATHARLSKRSAAETENDRQETAKFILKLAANARRSAA